MDVGTFDGVFQVLSQKTPYRVPVPGYRYLANIYYFKINSHPIKNLTKINKMKK
jgi:hypothetical protein